MTKKETLTELEDIARKLSYEVSYDALKKAAPYVRSGGVKLKEKKMILIDKGISIDKKIRVILEVISVEPLEGIFIKPYIKGLIEKFYQANLKVT